MQRKSLVILILAAAFMSWPVSATEQRNVTPTFMSDVATDMADGLSGWVVGFVAEALELLAPSQAHPAPLGSADDDDTQSQPTDETAGPFEPVANIHPEIDPNG